MKNISARDYDVFKHPEAPFEKEPSGSDFFIVIDGDGFSWSTNGNTIQSNIGSITKATSEIRKWAASNNLSGKVWLLDGDSRKYIGEVG